MQNDGYIISICTNVNVNTNTITNININTINFKDLVEYKFNKCISDKHTDFITINEFNIISKDKFNSKIGFAKCLLKLDIDGEKYKPITVTIQQALCIIQIFNKNKSILQKIFKNIIIDSDKKDTNGVNTKNIYNGNINNIYNNTYIYSKKNRNAFLEILEYKMITV